MSSHTRPSCVYPSGSDVFAEFRQVTSGLQNAAKTSEPYTSSIRRHTRGGSECIGQFDEKLFQPGPYIPHRRAHFSRLLDLSMKQVFRVVHHLLDRLRGSFSARLGRYRALVDRRSLHYRHPQGKRHARAHLSTFVVMSFSSKEYSSERESKGTGRSEWTKSCRCSLSASSSK